MKNSTTSNRQLKVAELIKMALIEVLRKGKAKDPILFDVPVTITEVKVSPDLKIAHCYVLPFNSNIPKTELMAAFENSRYHLRGLVTDKIQLKYSPELRFFYDNGMQNSAHVDDLLKNLS
jgi:ribosome-binding factor A